MAAREDLPAWGVDAREDHLLQGGKGGVVREALHGVREDGYPEPLRRCTHGTRVCCGNFQKNCGENFRGEMVKVGTWLCTRADEPGIYTVYRIVLDEDICGREKILQVMVFSKPSPGESTVTTRFRVPSPERTRAFFFEKRWRAVF